MAHDACPRRRGGTAESTIVGCERKPVRMTWTSLRTDALDGRLLAAVMACRQ